MQTQFTRDVRCFRELGRLLDTHHRLPGGEGLRTDGPCISGGQEMPTPAKPIVNRGMSGQETLGLPGGLEPSHLPFLLPGRLMGELGSVI